MSSNNEIIKGILRRKNIYQWRIAEEIGVSEVTFCKYLRRPLSEELEKKIYDAIDSVERERNEQ